MDARRLLEDERRGWERLRGIVERIAPDRIDVPTVTPEGWSPKDVLAHVATWLDRCGEVLEGIAAGTWDPSSDDDSSEAIDRFNAERAEAARRLGPREVDETLARARERARASLAALERVDDEAWSWFEESGPMHYAKHAHDLLAFVDGIHPDPEVGPLLQRETHAWLELAGALEAVPRADLEDPTEGGWSPRDAMYHLAAWLDHAAPAVERNSYWYEGGPPAPTDVIERLNAGFLERAQGVAPDEARRALEDARGRMRMAFSSLTSPSALAKRAFRIATVEHYAEHLPRIRARITGTDGDRA